MKARELRHKVELQEKSTSYAGETWSKVRDQFCRIKPLSSSLLLNLSAKGASVTHLIEFSDFPAIHIGMRAREEWFRQSIVDVDQDEQQFVLQGNWVGYFTKSCRFEVDGSAKNNGSYVVSAVRLVMEEESTYTVITTVEPIPDEKIDGAVILARVFEVDGVRLETKKQIATAVQVQ